MYECPNCGGNLKFDIERQKLYCEFCNTEADPYSFYKEKDAEESAEYEATVFTCPQCGGQLISEDTTAATFCSFCGASTILDSRISKERRPEFIVPFTKTKEDCKNSYNKMMRRAIFAPDELKNPDNIEKFRGIYMPYWVYSFEQKGQIHFSGQRTHRRGDYLITKHYQLESDIDGEYKGLAYDASSSFSDNLSSAIAPFDPEQGKDFVPSFLSGFYADTNDVGKEVYSEEAEDLATDDSAGKISGHPVCKHYSVNEYDLKNAVRPTKSDVKLAMLPVWFLSYRSGDRVSYAIVNGQTGKAAGDIPIDFKKYLIGSALLAVPLFFLLNLFFTITPTKILMLAAGLALLCALVANVQISNIFARESGEDDKGLASAKASSAAKKSFTGNRQRQNPRRTYAAGAVRPILAMILPFLLLPYIFNMLFHLSYKSVLSLTVVILVVFAVWRAFTPQPSFKRLRKIRFERYTGHWKEKLPTLAKPLGGILLAILILLINPVSDWYYYIGAFVCMGTVIWVIFDIIKHHNMLSTRKLPQFNKRGGDEN